jgi:hypothetical protein
VGRILGSHARGEERAVAGARQLPATFMRFTRIEPTVLAP